ncbi:MAG: hypothetical protein Q4B96_07660 [Bacillota bacterium]|nr:hypothetical protein [Bacillota bacterium]
MKHSIRKKPLSWLRANLFAILFFLLIAGSFGYALNSAAADSQAEGLRLAEDSLRRAVITCYAVEGRYPASYEYIRDNYGVRIDESKYFVDYEVFATNIMPTLTIRSL